MEQREQRFIETIGVYPYFIHNGYGLYTYRVYREKAVPSVPFVPHFLKNALTISIPWVIIDSTKERSAKS